MDKLVYLFTESKKLWRLRRDFKDNSTLKSQKVLQSWSTWLIYKEQELLFSPEVLMVIHWENSMKIFNLRGNADSFIS